jgi:hypothetical protein
MWGRVARRYLTLPNQGYHVATSVHADTIDDVVNMYRRDLRLTSVDVRRLGLVINIGLVGHIYPPRRRWFSTHFIQPFATPGQPDAIVPIPLSLWNEFDDTFEHADQTILDNLAAWLSISTQEFTQGLKLRVDCLRKLSQGSGATAQEMHEAIANLRHP